MSTHNAKDQNRERAMQKKPIGGGDIVTDFIEDIWEVMTPELVDQLRRVLTENMGPSKKDADKFIQCQRDINRQRICLKKGRRVVKIGVRNQWIKELSKDIADQMAMFVVGILLADRTARTKKITEKVLDHLCEITGEDTTVETAKTRVERMMVVVADRIATWIDENISEIEKKLKCFEKYKTAESLEHLSVATLSSMRSLKSWSSLGSSDVLSEIASKLSSSIISTTTEGSETDDDEEIQTTEEQTDSMDEEGESGVDEEEMSEEEEVEDKETSEEELLSEEESEKSSAEELTDNSEEEEERGAEKGSLEELSGEEGVKEEKEGEDNESEEQSEGNEETDEDSESKRLARTSSVSAELTDSEDELCSNCRIIVAEEEASRKSSREDEDREVVSDIISIESQKKLPADILDLLKEDVVRIPKEGAKSERQRAMKNIIDKRFEKLAREKLSKSLDSVVKFDIDEAASIVANWVESILSSADDVPELQVPPASPRQGPAFEIKQDKSQYEVHKLSSTTVAEKVAGLRGLNPPLWKKKVPRTMSPMNLKSTKDWADWVLGTAEVGEEWGKWLDATLADAENKMLRDPSSKRKSKQEKLQSWEAWRDSKGKEAQKWRAEKQRIRDEGALWNRKLQKEFNGENEKQTKVLTY